MPKWEYKKINILEDLEYYDEALNNADNQTERDNIFKQVEIGLDFKNKECLFYKIVKNSCKMTQCLKLKS